MAFGSATLMAIILIAVILIAIIAIRPGVTATRAGKILAFVAFLVFPILAGGVGISEHMERSKTTAFCLSCHTMNDYGLSLRVDDKSYIPAVHFQNNLVPRDNACYTCHTDYTMFGGISSKMRGLRHVYAQYIGSPSTPLKLYQPYNNRECLHCHQGSRSFEEGATHTADPSTIPKIKANQLSCSSSECHNVIHDVKGLKEAKFWKEAGQ